jgi:hypothetical protein
VFCWVFERFINNFFLSTYAKNCTFSWHHTLNQHIHIDTMYPSCITHFNIMIRIPLCENCKLCTYWYHLVWVFIFLSQYMHCHGKKNSKKMKSSYQMGMLKIQYQSNIGFLLCYFFRGQLVMYFQLSFFFPSSSHQTHGLLLGLVDFTYNFSVYGENCIDETTCMQRKGMNSRI